MSSLIRLVNGAQSPDGSDASDTEEACLEAFDRAPLDMFPIEHQLMVERLPYQRMLIAIWQSDHRAESLSVSGYLPFSGLVGLGEFAGGLEEGRVGWDMQPSIRPGIRVIDLVGDLVRTQVPDYPSRREDWVHYAEDMLFLALRNPATVPWDSQWPVRALANSDVQWARRFENLALLVGDETWAFWGDQASDQQLRSLIEPLPNLRRLFLVVACTVPPAIDNGRRLWGFLPLGPDTDWSTCRELDPGLETQDARTFEPFANRVRAVAESCGRVDLEIRTVLDVDMDRSLWDGDADRQMGLGDPAGPCVYRRRHPNAW